MNKTNISLCIPAYNSASYLPKLLKSALSQTVSFDEIWVYDDCSNDETAKVAQEFGAKVVVGNINSGCSFGKNILAQRTTCDWIHFHDADDVLYPNFVEKAYRWTQLKDAPDVVLFAYEVRDFITEEKYGVRIFDDERLKNDSISYAIQEQINPFCGLYRREAFLAAGGWDTDPLILQSEDQATHIKLAMSDLKFAADTTVTVINYIRPNSMTTSNVLGATRSMYHVLEKVTPKLAENYSVEISHRLWGIAGVCAAHLDWETADKCINLALSLDRNPPQSLSYFFRLLCQYNPHLAIRLREKLIRIFKPQIRHKFPTSV
ncbi:glycosyltransferase family 2 protein [Calothrix sp. NIES-3974]|uniref:glycosyltransferase family 2 protein n=1 Tax=Calothrix sp. NIES-3974 TaxID=2005462 RepID=UPI000B5EDBD5|nr:glycosyltransferase family 2 protein [Calothrix sp. NIES-3974]BAZ03595.1 glycosyl transferase family protein [Calothrix sp. NIES-3974]